MAEQVGKNITCDRCGETKFVKYLGDTALDGGFTRVQNFEKLSEGWKYSHDLNMQLCPYCNSIWTDIKNKFKGEYHK